MKNGTFLLGLGTQKAGTSWLQAYLATHPEVDFGRLKEYHTFNAINLPAYAHVLRRRDPAPWHRPRKFFSYLLRNRKLPTGEHLRRRLRQGEAYYDYFAERLGQPGIWVTGDMTPDYAGLDRRILGKIRVGFEQRDIGVKTVFLMRDPVERCISAVRMYRGRTFESHRLPIGAEDSVSDGVARLYASPHFEALTRYDRTLAEMTAEFSESDMLIGFYEMLFQTEEVARIDRFLGLTAGTPDFGKRVNASGFKGQSISEGLRARIANHYRPVYEDMFRRFGEQRIRALWPSAALL